MQKIIGAMRRAINDFSLIKNGDTVAVGVSGGKDSIALLTALSLYRRYSPEKFDLMGISIDVGFPEGKEGLKKIKEYSESLGTPFFIEETDIAQIVFEERKEKSPCSLCSKMRRGALNTSAIKHGANVVALGHHADDILDTFLLSFIYEGRLSTFKPYTYLDRTGVSVIRPFVYVQEGDIRGASRRLNFPIYKNPCPEDKHTEREYMKNLVDNITEDIPIARDRMISAIVNADRYSLFPEKNK